MVDFLTTYNPSDILIMVIALTVAIKGVWDLADFFIGKYKLKFNKDYTVIEKERIAEEKQKALEEHYINCTDQHKETLAKYSALEGKIDGLVDTINDKFSIMDERMDLLAESNVLNIKADIVQAFHFYVEQQGWIDDFALDILEKRYAVYKAEGGNSYVGGLMSEIRQLPKHPPI